MIVNKLERGRKLCGFDSFIHKLSNFPLSIIPSLTLSSSSLSLSLSLYTEENSMNINRK